MAAFLTGWRPSGAEIAIAISVAQPATAQARSYVAAQLPNVGRLISFTLPGGPGGQTVAGGGHAAALAEQISNHRWQWPVRQSRCWQADQKRITEIRRARSDDFPTYLRHGLDTELATLEARQAARTPAAEGPRQGDRAREAEIRKVLAKDYGQYRDQKLDVELSQILHRRGA